MDNSIYYTFSTIAQSLASVSALILAFCLFRLQSLESELRRRIERVNADSDIDTITIPKIDRLKNHIVERALGAEPAFSGGIDVTGSVYNFKRVAWLIPAISYITRLLVITLVLSFAVILFSVWILTITEHSLSTLIPEVLGTRSQLLDFGACLFGFALFFNGLTVFRVLRFE